MHRPGVSRRLATFAAITAAAITLAACGGSGSSSDSSTTTTKAATGDKTAMRAGLVRASDFPSNWRDTGKPSSSDSADETEKVARGIADCREFVEQSDIEDRQTKLESNEFENAVEAGIDPDQASSSSNEIVAYASEADAKTAYDVFAGSTTPSCLEQLFDELFAQQSAAGAEPGVPAPTFATTVDRLGVPAAGDATAGYQAVVTITVGDQSQQIALIVQLVRVGQYIVNYTATLFQPVPEGFGENVVTRSLDRFDAALARS